MANECLRCGVEEGGMHPHDCVTGKPAMTATPDQMQRAREYAAQRWDEFSPEHAAAIRAGRRDDADEVQSAYAAIIDGDAREAALREEVARLREALEPFAEHPDFHAPDDWAVTQFDNGDLMPEPGVTAGDFRRARAALKGGSHAD